jgi:TRAP-type C4-dicarboxylate transport system permease small subunit
VEFGVDLACLGFCLLILVLSLRFEWFLFEDGSISMSTYLPEWLGFLGLPVALLLMCIHYLQVLADRLRRPEG